MAGGKLGPDRGASRTVCAPVPGSPAVTAACGDMGSPAADTTAVLPACCAICPPRAAWFGLYEQLALAAEDLPIKADRRDREQIACTGMPEAPGTPAA
jgi:hypothetical protein